MPLEHAILVQAVEAQGAGSRRARGGGGDAAVVERLEHARVAGRRGDARRRDETDELAAAELGSARRGLGLDPRDHPMRRGCGDVHDVRRDLEAPVPERKAERLDPGQPARGRANGRRDLSCDAERSQQLEIERDERPADAEQHGTRSRINPRRPEVRRQLPELDAPLQLDEPTPAEERGPAVRRDRPVEEDRQPQIAPHPCANRERRTGRTVEILVDQRHDGDDVRRSDARVDAVVSPQVDPLPGLVDSGDQPVLERLIVADERDHRAVVVAVDVRVQHASAGAREGRRDRRDRRRVPPLGDVRHGLERGHGRTLRPMREPTAPAYYDRRAPEYDDWYLGRGRYATRTRVGFDEDLDDVCAALADLSPARTLDVACGTGFLTRHLRGELTGLDRSARMLEIAASRLPSASLVEGEALALPFEDDTFDRVVSGHFYGHLDDDQRARFVREVRRVAPELVLVDASRERSHTDEEWSERVLEDGSSWQVFKRWFTQDGLLAELGGGEVLHAGPWFVVVRSSR